MSVLDGKYFEGGGDIDTELVNKLVTTGLDEPLTRVLTELGWQGQAVGVIGLSVGPDGKRVTQAEFAVRGSLSGQSFSVQAAKWWDCDRDTMIEFPDMRGELFRFNSGNMCSEYISQDSLDYTVKKQGVVISDEERRQLGQFSIRMVAHLDKASNGRAGPQFKTTVLVFPRPVEQLEDIEAAQSASWAGVKILEAKCEMFPIARRGEWGAPFYPLIVTSERAAASRSVPSGESLRFCMAKLLGTAVLPTACTNRAGLARKWQEMQNQEPEVFERQPTVQWPDVPEPRTLPGE
jgi:hypothetical protein